MTGVVFHKDSTCAGRWAQKGALRDMEGSQGRQLQVPGPRPTRWSRWGQCVQDLSAHRRRDKPLSAGRQLFCDFPPKTLSYRRHSPTTAVLLTPGLRHVPQVGAGDAYTLPNWCHLTHRITDMPCRNGPRWLSLKAISPLSETPLRTGSTQDTPQIFLKF